MKHKIIILMFTVFICSYGFSKDYSTGEVMVGLSISGLHGGEQKDLLDATLSPKPDDYSSANFFVLGQYFPVKNFGIEAAYTFAGTTHANAEGYESLECLEQKIFEFGLVARLVTKLSDMADGSLDLSFGGTYSMITLADEYKSVMYLIEFYDIDPGFGFYIKGGGKVYIYDNLTAGISLQYMKLGNEFTSGAKFDGEYFNVLLSVGVAF